MHVKIAIKNKSKGNKFFFKFTVKLKRIKTLTKGYKLKEQKKKHYKLELKDETKNNETFIKNSRKKIKKS
jgi:hypothetical protein